MANVYVTLSEGKGAEITFDSLVSNSFKEMIRREPWLKWQKRKLGGSREKWFLIADLSDEGDRDEWGLNRLQRLTNAFLDDGLILNFRNNQEEDYVLDYEKFVWKDGERRPAPAKDKPVKPAKEEKKEPKGTPLIQERANIRTKRVCTVSDKSKIICLDAETTGTSYAWDEILQLSIIDGNGAVLFNEYIKPGRKKTWPMAQKTHGISPDMVADKPTIAAYIDQLSDIIAGADLIVGYNHEVFDLKFLWAAGVSLPEVIPSYDVMLEYAKKAGRQSLSACAEHFCYQGCGNFHDSLEDVRATLHCFYAMTE